MPKIIKDIEQKIFNAAMELFSEYGYSQVDMKMIAKKTNIAVGTLYNYYSCKEQLYIHVLKESWKHTYFQLNDVMQESISYKEKMIIFINILYDEMSNRKGLGLELIKANVLDEKSGDEFFRNIKEELFKQIELLILKTKEEEGIELEDGMERRLAETILLLIVQMNKGYLDEKEKNIQFINQIIKSFM